MNPEPHPVSSPSKAVDVLAVIDETIRKTEQAVPTPLKRYGESCEHPVHHASRLHDLRAIRAAVAELIAADKEYGAAEAAWNRVSRADLDPDEPAYQHARSRMRRASARRAAALSTIGESQ